MMYTKGEVKKAFPPQKFVWILQRDSFIYQKVICSVIGKAATFSKEVYIAYSLPLGIMSLPMLTGFILT